MHSSVFFPVHSSEIIIDISKTDGKLPYGKALSDNLPSCSVLAEAWQEGDPVRHQLGCGHCHRFCRLLFLLLYTSLPSPRPYVVLKEKLCFGLKESNCSVKTTPTQPSTGLPSSQRLERLGSSYWYRS